MKEVIGFKDATVTVNAGLLGGVHIDVECRNFKQENLTPSQFAALVYPAIDAAAKESDEHNPADPAANSNG